MKPLLRRPGFGGFPLAQAQVAFNDNATKLVLIGLVQWLLSAAVFHLSVAQQFLLLGVSMFVACLLAVHRLPQDLLRVVGLFLSRLRYSVRIVGAEHLPKTGGALIVCNHVSYVDTIILSLASPRPIRFLSHESFFKTPILSSILHLFGAIPVAPNRAKEALRRASDCIRAGELVCIFPEGQLTRTGSLMELKSGFEIIARRAECPVIVAHLDGLWGSIYSFEGGRYFTKLPRGLRRRTTVSFSAPLNAEAATTRRVREILLTLGEAAFRLRTGANLAKRILKTLSEDPFRTALVDPTGDGERVSHGALEEAIAEAFSGQPGQDCVVGVPCPDKGEELVLLTTRSIDREALRRNLASRALPNLWIPRTVIQVPQLPAFASGKLDLGGCLKLAEKAAATAR